MTTPSSRRTFLKTVAAAGVAAALPAAHAQAVKADGTFPVQADFYKSPGAAVIVSGGSIIQQGHFPEAVTEAHRKHFGPKRRVLLILHASLPADRDAMEHRLQAMFAADGYEAESLHHWDGIDGRRRIEGAEAIFIGGGETFLLLRTLIETRQLKTLRETILGGIPVHGTSAGANVAGPVIGCTNDFPIVDVPTRTSLGVFPAVINPHHPAADEREYGGRLSKIRTYLRYNPTETVLGLGNGALARLHAGRVELLNGLGVLYQGSTRRELPVGEIPELTSLVTNHG